MVVEAGDIVYLRGTNEAVRSYFQTFPEPKESRLHAANIGAAIDHAPRVGSVVLTRRACASNLETAAGMLS